MLPVQQQAAWQAQLSPRRYVDKDQQAVHTSTAAAPLLLTAEGAWRLVCAGPYFAPRAACDAALNCSAPTFAAHNFASTGVHTELRGANMRALRL